MSIYIRYPTIPTGSGSISSINGQAGPNVDIVPGLGIGVSASGNDITVANTYPLNLIRVIWVDGVGGDDSIGTGVEANPFKTIQAGQAVLTGLSAATPGALMILPAFYAEDPSWQPVQYVDYIGVDRTNTFVGHSDDSDIILTYNEDNFNQGFYNLTFYDSIQIISNGVGTGPIVSQLQSYFEFVNCILPGSMTLTGSGNTGSGPFLFDTVLFQNCFAAGTSPITTHAFLTNIDQCDIGFVNMNGVGVDMTTSDYLTSTWNNSSMRNITLTGFNDVRANNCKINRIHLTDNTATYEADAVSMPQGQFQVSLTGGAAINQILKKTSNVRTFNANIVADSTPFTLSAFSDFIVGVNQSPPGPATINLPALIAGDRSSEGNQYIIFDALGDAATNNITIVAGGTDTFQGGGTSITIAENFGWREITYQQGVWAVTSSSTHVFNGDITINGKLTVSGSIDPINILLSGGDKRFGATDAGPIYLAPNIDQAGAVEIRKADNITAVVSVDTSSGSVLINGNTNINALGLHNDWTTQYWGSNQTGILSDSTIYNQPTQGTRALQFGSTDVGGIGNNQSYISPDLNIGTGDNLGDNLALSGGVATGNIWIHSGDIPNDLSTLSYRPGDINIVTGYNAQENISGGLLLDARGLGNQGAAPGEVRIRALDTRFVSPSDGTTVIVEVDCNLNNLNLFGNPIVSVADPSSAQDAATKNYVDTTPSVAKALTNTTQTLADGDSIDSSKASLALSSGGPVTTSAVTPIVNGTLQGQVLVVANVGSNTITIKATANVELPGLIDYTLGANDSISFIWMGSKWYTTSSSVN